MEPEQETKLSQEKIPTSMRSTMSMRDSGIDISPCNCGSAIGRQNSDCLVFQFDDIPMSSDIQNKEVDFTEVIEEQPEDLSLNLVCSACGSHASIPHSRHQGDQENLTCGTSKALRRSFRAQVSAVDIVMPFARQRHTNFTPPRISPHILDEDRDDSVPLSSLIHQRRSSAFKCDVEKEVGESLRSFSDIFNVESVGLGHGYHVHDHPHCRYNRPFSSSFPGAPPSATLHHVSWHGVKTRKKSHLVARDLYGSFFS